MSLHDFAWFSALAAVIAIATHSLIRHFGIAVLLGASVSSAINIAYEAVTYHFVVRPVDVLVWLPFMLFEGALLALPAVVIAGVPFFIVRGRRKSAEAGNRDPIP